MVDRETLTKYADDSEVTVASWNDDEIVLRIRVDSHGGEVWLLRMANVCHVDMASGFILGSTAFGGQELLPPVTAWGNPGKAVQENRLSGSSPYPRKLIIRLLPFCYPNAIFDYKIRCNKKQFNIR